MGDDNIETSRRTFAWLELTARLGMQGEHGPGIFLLVAWVMKAHALLDTMNTLRESGLDLKLADVADVVKLLLAECPYGPPLRQADQPDDGPGSPAGDGPRAPAGPGDETV